MDDPLHIDLDQHAVIEASAGTGKTYTLVELVLRLLAEKKATLDQILLVTFTEKATGELKERLRQALEARPGPLFEAALDAFDQAPIFTIHGFCQRLLTEYALEQGQDLRRTHVSDKVLVEPALREVQRRLWCRDFGDQLQQVLDFANYNFGHAEAWDRKVCDLAGRFHEEFGQRLLPAAGPDALNLEARAAACRALADKLRGHTGPIPDDPLKHTWDDAFLNIRMNHNTRTHRLEKIIHPLLRWLGDPASDRYPLRTFLHLQETLAQAYGTESLKSVFADKGYTAFFEKMSADVRQAIAEKCPGLTQSLTDLEEFRRTIGMQRPADLLAVMTVTAARRIMAEVKAERGQISFDDMIAQVARALERADAGPLLDLLRDRFRYAVVDEFQDTDPLQWRIFRRLFLEGGKTRLIVVGDPKQAIFGFRGADLPTYLLAARDMEQSFQAGKYPLRTNWRSVAELLVPLNLLFVHPSWFAPEGSIPYLPVQPPPREERRVHVPTQALARAPLTIVDLQEATTLTRARVQFARFAADEIRRLLAANITYVKKREPHTLNAGDICLLVFRRREAEPLIDALRAADLPFTFYKQTGLWQSTEAEHLGIILEALAAPDDRAAFRKALLTSFFRLTPEELALCADIPPRHPVRVLFHTWLAYAEERQWSALAQSLLEDTGVLFYDLSGALDRRVSNLRSLLATLTEVAYRDNLGLLDLIEAYKNLRRGADELQQDWQPIETDQAKIKIMTIHASKGLEFPVVFLAGGFTRSPSGPIVVYHDADNQRVFDLNPDPAAKALNQAEVTAENRRLLYVGLTRAMLKLYVPLVTAEPNNRFAGPVVTLLGQALQETNPAQLGPAHAEIVNCQGTVPASPGGQLASVDPPVELPGELFPTLTANLGKRRLVVRSFSSLHRAAATINFSDETPRAQDEGPELPDDPFRGTVFGEIVHQILEKIDFAAVGTTRGPADLIEANTPLRAVLDGPITRHLPKMRSRVPPAQFADACRQRVAELVWKALRTPLPELGGRLCDVPAADRIHELEFFYPRYFGAAPPAEVDVEEGFFTGIMDLVFRKDGLYYLLDWKTNLLDAYDAPGLAQAMDFGDYHRQYRLYLQALKRWLERRHGQGLDFLKQCGGVYYLFLRGLTGSADSAGIFFHRPGTSDLDLDSVLK